MGAVVEENIWSWSCVWRRLGPVLKQCQTPEVGGSSGASSLNSRTWARDRMPTTALRSALSRSQQADHRKNKRTRVEGKGDKRETEKKWNRLRPTDRILGRGTILSLCIQPYDTFHPRFHIQTDILLNTIFFWRAMFDHTVWIMAAFIHLVMEKSKTSTHPDMWCG